MAWVAAGSLPGLGEEFLFQVTLRCGALEWATRHARNVGLLGYVGMSSMCFFGGRAKLCLRNNESSKCFER